MSGEGYSSFDVRIRAVLAVERGWAVGDAADAFGITRRTLHRWLRRYEKNGEDGLERRPGSGRPRKLDELDEDELRGIVLRRLVECRTAFLLLYKTVQNLISQGCVHLLVLILCDFYTTRACRTGFPSRRRGFGG